MSVERSGKYGQKLWTSPRTYVDCVGRHSMWLGRAVDWLLRRRRETKPDAVARQLDEMAAERDEDRRERHKDVVRLREIEAEIEFERRMAGGR